MLNKSVQELEYYFDANFRIIDNIEEFREWISGYTSFFAFDTETTGLHIQDLELVGCSFFDGFTPPVYIQFNFRDKILVKIPDPNNKRRKIDSYVDYEKTDAIDIKDALPLLKEKLENSSVITANGKFDKKVVYKYGIDLKVYGDTQLLSYVYASTTPNGLKQNASEIVGIDMTSYEETTGGTKSKGSLNIDWDKVDWQAYGRYGARDAFATYFLYYKLLPLVENVGKGVGGLDDADVMSCYENVELPLVEVVAEMEIHGVNIDKEYIRVIKRKLEHKVKEAQEAIYNFIGLEFNIGSSKQLGEILFDKLKLPVISKTDKGANGVGEDVLKELAYRGYEIAEMIIEYRKLNKILSTYTDALLEKVDKDGRLRGGFNQTGTSTGRFSSNNPNLQNIVVNEDFNIRKAFIPADGSVFVGGDYSQLELRVMAHMSKDKTLIEAFLNDEDLHQRTADEISKLIHQKLKRSVGKTLNFSVLYGMSAPMLARKLNSGLKQSFRQGKITKEELKAGFIDEKLAQELINGFYRAYDGFAKAGQQEAMKAKKRGFAESISGRIRHIPELQNKYTFEQGKRYAVSHWIQGSAADIVKMAMVNVYNRLKKEGLPFKPILQVHDEFWLEVPAYIAEKVRDTMQYEMENVYPTFLVPLKCDIGIYDNWAELKGGKAEKDDLLIYLILGLV